MVKRFKSIMETLKPYGEGVFDRNEELEEMHKFKDRIISLTFNEEHANLAHLNLVDVYKHFEQLNAESGNRADELLRRFEISNKDLHNFIKGLESGEKGEKKALRYLDSIKTEHIILSNIELSDENLRSEIDFLVITPHELTIVEVKNTKRNIFISENGSYYRTGEFNTFDCQIKEKLNIKEQLLRKALGDSQENIHINSVLLFTDSRIKVQNQCAGINVCFADQLSHIIGSFEYASINETVRMSEIKETILKAEKKTKYPIKFDLEKYKEEFATLMTCLEEHSLQAKWEESINEKLISDSRDDFEEVNEEEVKKAKISFKNILGSKYFKWACGGLVCGASAIMCTVLLGKVFNQ